MTDARLERKKIELGAFLKRKREALSPLSVGLANMRRRRTPGLRREEVAAMAGVGVTWYTWLEQGRDIGVSNFVLERVADVLKLDEVERRHLFLLAQKCAPPCRGQTSCEIPAMARLLLDDLALRPAYLFNLRWDVLAWNQAAQRLFDFQAHNPNERNMLWMLFADNRLNSRIGDWSEQAPMFVASFRRDFARAPEDEGMVGLAETLQSVSPLFKEYWQSQKVHGRCRGKRMITVNGMTPTEFEHFTFIVDPDQHLRMALYATSDAAMGRELFG